jgi:hypothetical protein
MEIKYQHMADMMSQKVTENNAFIQDTQKELNRMIALAKYLQEMVS